MTKVKLLTLALWSLAIASVLAFLVVRAGGDESTPRTPVSTPIIEQDDGLDRLFAVEPFTLTEHTGEPFDSASLRGTPWVGFVFLTHCPTGACPVMVGKMNDLQDALGDTPVEFVSVTIDPERDTPDQLRRYVQTVAGDAPGDRWHLLTADTQAETLAVAAKLKLGVNPDDFTHATQFLLVDADGFVRGVYGNTDNDAMAHLAEDARTLVEQGGR